MGENIEIYIEICFYTSKKKKKKKKKKKRYVICKNTNLKSQCSYSYSKEREEKKKLAHLYLGIIKTQLLVFILFTTVELWPSG